MRPLPPAALLREMFSYDEESGVLHWRNGRGHKMRPMSRAGWVHKQGACMYVEFSGRKYKVHRVIWKIVTGSDPVSEIDHINGVGTDNRWCNLRAATHLQNMRNARRRIDNESGFKGVGFHRQMNKWRARLQVDGVEKSLGLFDTAEEAHRAYLRAAKSAFGEFMRAG
jgi:hypothetical protein